MRLLWVNLQLGLVSFHFMITLFVGAVKHSIPIIMNAGFLITTNPTFSTELILTVGGVSHFVS